MRRILVALLVLGNLSVGQEPTLLVPLYFFHGHSVGAGNRTTGLQVSRDGGKSFQGLTWPELITNSVAVDGSGAHVYLACGNGVLISRDGGRSWRLTGGIELTEVQRVVIDRGDPEAAFAASAYGIYRKEAGSERWIRGEGGFRYASDVIQDVDDPNRLWAGTFEGLFESRDGGRSFAPTSLSGFPVRRIFQDPAGRLFAATDGAGLQVSRDRRAFERLAGSPDTVFCLAWDGPRLHLGGKDGLHTTEDEGASWTRSSNGLPEEYLIYGIALDPGVDRRLILSGNDGLVESRDGGRTFARLAFEDALIPDVRFAVLAEMERDGPSWAPSAPLSYPKPPPGSDWRHPCEAFSARRAELLADFRALALPEDGWPGFERAALLAVNDSADEALFEAALERLERPSHSMFFTLPVMGFYLHAQRALPEALADRIRDVLTGVPIYRGDTENHWVMHYSALLLAAETWPETPAAAWYTGQESAVNHAEAKAWLEHWARTTATIGQGEFDSPNYFFMFTTPMFLLHDFARDPEVRRLAGMMLDLLLADYLTESLQGAWVGGHSRVIGEELTKGRETRVALFHWLFAGGIPKPATAHPWALFAGLSDYLPPRQFQGIVSDPRPRFQTERKRVRNVIRFGETLNPPVYKRCLMTPIYGLGSLQGGILQPIQQHTWDVTWLGSARNATLFTVHPSISTLELARFFPEEIHDIERTITLQKGAYGCPDKLISASPWERIHQEGNLLLALYAIPEDARFPHVDLYWPDCLALEAIGPWLLGRDGEFYLAVYPTAQGTWLPGDDFRRLRHQAGTLGFVVITRPFDENGLIGTYEAFKHQILSGPIPQLQSNNGPPSLTHGTTELSFAHPHTLPPDILFDGPFLQARLGQAIIRITDTTTTRTLDFTTLTITDSP